MQLSLDLLRSFQQQHSFFYSNYDKHDQKNKDDRDKSNSDKHNTITLNIAITEDDYYNKSEKFFTLLCLVVSAILPSWSSYQVDPHVDINILPCRWMVLENIN